MKRLLFPVILFAFLATGAAFSATGNTTAKKKSTATSRKSGATTRSRSSAKTTSAKPTKGKATAKSKKHVPTKAELARMRRLHRAFVASATLKPMARQLVQDRTKAAYAGVEAYARKHAGTDAAPLAWFVLGYAHSLDHDYPQAITAYKKARVNPGDLADYVTYELASAYANNSQPGEAIALLQDFETKYPDSTFRRDAALTYANTLLASGNAAKAVQVLEAHRTPTSADVELGLGRAYLAAGDVPKGGSTLRHLWLTMPVSGQASDARGLLNTVASQLPPLTFAERKQHADALAGARRFRDAANEYASLRDEAPPDMRSQIDIAYGIALHRSGNDGKARDLLANNPDAGDELGAQRALAMVEMSRSAQDEDALQSWLGVLREKHPASPALEDALLHTANMYLLKKDYDRAIDYFRELQQRFPQGRRGSYAHWKATWLTYRQGRKDEAKKLFEEQIDWYSQGGEVPAAVYWRGRVAEAEGDLPTAYAYYSKLDTRFRQYYYATLARARMKTMSSLADPPAVALLDKIPPVPSLALDAQDTPEEDLRASRAALLQNAGLVDLAVRELQAGTNGKSASWATVQIAKVYEDNGMHWRAIEAMKRAVPSYFAVDASSLPREYWESLFPRPFWPDLKRNAQSNSFDPYLIASLIRQESEFNPGAISHANAFGLMQVLPGTGRNVARALKIRRFSADQLLVPSVNLQIGTRYFRETVDHFNGQVEYALAAYNAGSDRVDQWLADGRFHDVDEFVESIPFTETREYVQAIMRNAAVYRSLYGTP